MTTGQRIKARRKQLGISAEVLAAKLNISPATIYRYENGDIEKVPGDRLAPIAEALSTTPAFLMGWEDQLTTEQQIDIYISGAKSWAADFRFSSEQRIRITEYLADSALKLKEVINHLANAEQCDGKILTNPALQQSLNNIANWTASALKYVNNDSSEDPFDEDNVKAEYLSAISKLSRRDQVAWLIRLQDYVEEHYPSTDG